MMETKEINKDFMIQSLQNRIAVISSNNAIEIAECHAIIEDQRVEIETLKNKKIGK